MKRYSHVPTSSEILEDIEALNDSSLYSMIGRKSLQTLQQRDSAFLKKRGRKPEHKITFSNPSSDYSDSESNKQGLTYPYYN